ncbi:cytochrome c oxidase subunit 3 [Herbaspirillum sp. SJZ107]|uniref:cytochrome c oxidase subunit 3 n=1 Tax=Herbaspirillum sp. SJZ107 TaxID=2572881 RepID=UPI001153595E|nr:cytochrome c oxidase subunit 3 [Herbaspirillum sp. SJZ107]TQK08281.1 cytochrome bb3 quinol oxidase subunit 3 [Herbaspirillum sp. SJZ107]
MSAMLDEPMQTIERPIPRSQRGPAAPHVTTSYGMWLFLLSDIVMFAAFFAAFVVLRDHTAGGPAGRDLFHRHTVLIETGCLLFSSFSCALLGVGVEYRNKAVTYIAAAVTLALGAAFMVLELSEFTQMIADGAGPGRSAFLSGFFALVGLHGLHVACGMLWLVVMLAQVATLGFSPKVVRRLQCFNLFWHALDIVWVGVFTVVYLGAFT